MLQTIKKYIGEHPKTVVWVFVAVAALLAGYASMTRSLWMDETAVLEYLHATPHPVDFVIQYFKVPDNHPPLYYFLVLVFYKLFPFGELGIRLVSIVAGLGVIGMTYKTAKLFFMDRVVPVLAAAMVALSPFFLLYASMARYHTLAGFFALSGFYCFIRFLRDPSMRRYLVAFVSLSILTGWTDVPHFVYLVCVANIWYLLALWKKRAPVRPTEWAIGQTITVLAFLPIVWLYYLRIRFQGDGLSATSSLLGKGIINFLTDFSVHFYQFIFGETVLPWNYIPFGLGLAVLAVVCWKSIAIFFKKGDVAMRQLVALVFGLVLFNAVLMSILDARYNFIVLPKYGFVAFPFFMILAAGMLYGLRDVRWRVGLIGVLFAVQLFGTWNLLTLRNYMNPSYFRGMDSFTYVERHSLPGDRLLITGDANPGVYDFYRLAYFRNLQPITENELAMDKQTKEHMRVWTFATGSEEDGGTDPRQKIPGGFSVIDAYESTPIDPVFKRIKERILHRPSYTYKYGVYLIANR